MVKLHEFTVIYPDKTKAIDRLTLNIAAGENIALLGGNGAGKTTLLLALAGIVEAAGGTATIGGTLLNKKTVDGIRRQLGLVFQNPDDQLFMPCLYDDIAFGCRNLGLEPAAVENRVTETLNQLQIGCLRERSSLKLSGGEKRMAAIATVLAMRPAVLMFDEPTAFLDPPARRRLIKTLTALPHTKIIATHDMGLAAQLCRRVVILKEGRMVADGGCELLYEQKLMEDYGLEALK